MIQIDWKALRSRQGLAMTGLTLVFGLLILAMGEWSRPPRYIPEDRVWAVVHKEASRHGLDPHFVFAVVAAESSFNARARNGDARGLMQIRPIAWKEVSPSGHWQAWRWKKNIAVGTAYLAHLKEFLDDHGQFSYPMLAACYRHGPYRVKETGFRLNQLPEPQNRIYRELHRGNLRPVKTPNA